MTAMSNVLLLNLRSGENAPKTYEDVVSSQQTDQSSSNNTLSTGIRKFTSLLVVDTLAGLRKNQGLYESILRSSTLPHVILVVTDCEGSESESSTKAKTNPKIDLPEIFEQRSSNVRVILLTSRTGTLWALESPKPEGVAVWDQDPDGNATLQVIIDCLVLPEVFSEAFQLMEAGGRDAWSIGTKQVWFGTLPKKAMVGALFEIAKTFLGENGDVVLLRRIEPWTIDPDLIGRAEESNILEPQGRIITKLEEIRKLEETFSQNAGVRSNKGFINRLINFPHRTKADAQKLHEKLVETDRYLIELIEAIVPEDGFQKEEEKKIEHAGIKLRLETDQRAKTYQKSDEKLIQVIVNGTDKALVDGHSIIPIKNEIDGLIELVTPRTSEQILHGIVNFEDSAYVGKNGYQDFEFGYDGVSFDKTAKKIREGLSSTPKNPILKIARVLAKIIRHMWVRAILAFLYLWALAVAAFEAFDQGRSNGFVPLPITVRQSVANVVVVAFLILSLLLIIGGVILNLSHEQIIKWGRTFGAHDIVKEQQIEANREFISKVVFNEWVLYSRRVDILGQLRVLVLILQQIEEELSQLYDHEKSEIDGIKIIEPNPAVREDFNVYSQAGFFAQYDKVFGILRADILEIIMPKLKVRVLELKDRLHRDGVPAIVREDISQPLGKYVEHVVKRGVLSGNLFEDVAGSERRKILTEDYWNEVQGIAEVIRKTVCHEELEPVVQLVRPEDFRLLHSGREEAATIRFCPTPSRDKLGEQESPDTLREIVFTEAVNTAGIVRLVPFREGVVTYSDPSDSSESLEP